MLSIRRAAVIWPAACFLSLSAAACGSSDTTSPPNQTPTDTTTTPTGPRPSGDVAVAGVQFTQGVQDSTGSIPMVANGGDAVANVYLAATPEFTPVRVVLRMFNASNTLTSTDTVTSLGATALGTGLPTAQFLVRAPRLVTGANWQVEVLPAANQADDTTSNDVFPRTGTTSLSVVTVPPLTIRFVPIVLSANGNAVSSISSDSLTNYLQTLRSIHPLGVVSAHIGASFTTGASFGTAPAGGDASFWTELIAELDLARIADPTEPTVNWFGVVQPPLHFTFTNFGGFSYIPTSGTDAGAHTRTSSAVGPGWFNAPTQARDLVAHEIGHTFGRAHAPCGGAGAPLDAAYPVPGGRIDQAGFDVYSWSYGLTSGAAQIPVSSGDVMGYCFPVWESVYTYKAILNFRAGAVVADGAPQPRTRVLAIRGSIDDRTGVSLAPAFSIDARPTAPDAEGAYTLTGTDAVGRVLFTYRFDGARIDHDSHVRHFTVTVPETQELDAALASVSVSGPAGSALVSRRPAPASGATLDKIPAIHRNADGSIAAGCPASSRGVAILDASTGTMLGVSPNASLNLPAGAATGITVLCSDGLMTTRATATLARLY